MYLYLGVATILSTLATVCIRYLIFMITKLSIKNGSVRWAVVAHTFNPRTGKAEAGGYLSLRAAGLQSKFQDSLSQKKKKKNKNKNSQKEWLSSFLFSALFNYTAVLKVPVGHVPTYSHSSLICFLYHSVSVS